MLFYLGGGSGLGMVTRLLSTLSKVVIFFLENTAFFIVLVGPQLLYSKTIFLFQTTILQGKYFSRTPFLILGSLYIFFL